MPRTSTPEARPCAETITCPRMSGAALVTPGTAAIRAVTAS